MNPMQCQIQNHKGKQIIAVCMNKECKKSKLSCWNCIVEFHGSHTDSCIEIDLINDFIKQESNKQVNQFESCNSGQKQFIQSLEKFMELIEILKKIVMDKINNFQTILFENINRINEIIKGKIEMIKSQNLQGYFKKTINSFQQMENSQLQQGNEYWNQIEGILQYVEVEKCAIKLKISKEGELNELDKQQMKLIHQSIESIQSMINQMNSLQMKVDIPAQTKIRKLCFDKKKKNINFTIIDESTIKSTDINLLAMAFANEGFDPRNQSYAFAFNIQNIQGNILVGVGNEEGIKESFTINTLIKELGHGQYMINSISKYTYHHTDQQFQNTQNGIEFQTGDKIQIKYDHVAKVLEFRNSSNQNNVLKMPITDMTKILYPCVMCNSEGNQVQIVQY